MINKILNILKHRISYNYLCIVCVIMILIYTLQRHFAIEPSIMAIIWLFVMIGVLVGAIAVIYFVLRDSSKKDFQERVKACRECATKISKHQFVNFDLLTFDELIQIEASLQNDLHPEECYVYIYTSNISTEDDAETTVMDNINVGVNYRVFYIDGKPTQKRKELYGSKHLIPCTASEIDRSADFDITIYVDSSKNVKGYFCVNFSKVNDGPRPCSQGYSCSNPCNYQNENLLYKKIRDDTVELLLKTLREKEEKYEE